MPIVKDLEEARRLPVPVEAQPDTRRSSSLEDDDVYYYIRWRLELEGETENTGVCTKERKGVTAAVLWPLPALIHPS